MGYRSNITIGVHKSIIITDLISPVIPNSLKTESYTDIGDVRYWELDWKWYDSYPEVQAVLAFFEYLSDQPNIMMSPDTNTHSIEVYGAIRLGEDTGDIEEWGSPNEYEIYTSQAISSPVSN